MPDISSLPRLPDFLGRTATDEGLLLSLRIQDSNYYFPGPLSGSSDLAGSCAGRLGNSIRRGARLSSGSVQRYRAPEISAAYSPESNCDPVVARCGVRIAVRIPKWRIDLLPGHHTIWTRRGCALFMANRFCIVVPHYNHDRQLAELLPKLLGCGLPIVVVDDGSEERSREAIEVLVAHSDQGIVRGA